MSLKICGQSMPFKGTLQLYLFIRLPKPCLTPLFSKTTSFFDSDAFIIWDVVSVVNAARLLNNQATAAV